MLGIDRNHLHQVKSTLYFMIINKTRILLFSKSSLSPERVRPYNYSMYSANFGLRNFSQTTNQTYRFSKCLVANDIL